MGTKVTPYESSQDDKKAQVRTMFDKIAPVYDLLNGVLSLNTDTRWRRKAINKLKDKNPKTLLDIATGTGDVAVEANKQLQLESIVALDLSPNMIDLAKKKMTKKGLDQIIFPEVGDSENLRFEDESFDAVTVSFGVRNFGNLKQGLSEIYRVINPNGSLVVLEFSKPTIFPFKQIFNFYFKNILPFIGKLTSKDPAAYKYLYESVQVFPDYDDFAIILKEIGFKEVTWKPLTLGICTIYFAQK
jgi:demethylmenaquinone methyltransferase/2-methoxy-6-polyprenyl-1,4-benzoquinol methylase